MSAGLSDPGRVCLRPVTDPPSAFTSPVEGNRFDLLNCAHGRGKSRDPPVPSGWAADWPGPGGSGVGMCPGRTVGRSQASGTRVLLSRQRLHRLPTASGLYPERCPLRAAGGCPEAQRRWVPSENQKVCSGNRKHHFTAAPSRPLERGSPRPRSAFSCLTSTPFPEGNRM